MYMLMVGELEVISKGQRLGFLSDGAFFGEVPILDDSAGSEVRTRTIIAMTDCRMCFLRAEDTKELRERYPELALRMMRFAKVGKVNTCKKGFRMQMVSPSARLRISAVIYLPLARQTCRADEVCVRPRRETSNAVCRE